MKIVYSDNSKDFLAFSTQGKLHILKVYKKIAVTPKNISFLKEILL